MRCIQLDKGPGRGSRVLRQAWRSTEAPLASPTLLLPLTIPKDTRRGCRLMFEEGTHTFDLLFTAAVLIHNQQTYISMKKNLKKSVVCFHCIQRMEYGSFFLSQQKKTQQCTVVSSIPYTTANSNTYNTQSVTFTHTCAGPSVVCNIHVPTKATARATIKQRERIKEKRSALTTERRRKGVPEAYGGVKKPFFFFFLLVQSLSCYWII